MENNPDGYIPIFHNSSNNNKIKILKKKGITLIKSKADNKRLKAALESFEKESFVDEKPKEES